VWDGHIDTYKIDIRIPAGMGSVAVNSDYAIGTEPGTEIYRYRPDNHPDVLPGGKNFSSGTGKTTIIGPGDEEKVGSLCCQKPYSIEVRNFVIAIDVPGQPRSIQKLSIQDLFC
jgi:hypothetical protein